jgi:hypothetical protein
MDRIPEVVNSVPRALKLGKKLFAMSGVALLIALISTGYGVGQEPKAARKTQGSGIKLTLTKKFIDDFADVATIESDFRVDDVGAIHKAVDDGEVHIGGVAAAAKLATVAELTNPQKPMVKRFRELAKNGPNPTDRTIHLKGVWRLWMEHPGTLDQDQNGTLPKNFNKSNPDHIFEIHPISDVDGTSLLDTFRPISGFPAHDIQDAVSAYENVPCKIRVDGDNVTINSKSIGFNFTKFELEFLEDPHIIPDGILVLCHINDLDGELVARRRRIVFVQGTQAEAKGRTMKEGDRLKVLGLVRMNLRLIKWRIENSRDPSDPEDPLNWDLPYEIVVIGVLSDGE